MEIGDRLKNLRIQKNLTQEELGERTDLTKGYISQLERNLSSPSMDTFFHILAVLGSTPKQFFSEQTQEPKIIYKAADMTTYYDEENGYEIKWLISESNEKEMEPIILTFEKRGEYKTFAPSLSETFIYVLEGTVSLVSGGHTYRAKQGEAIYYKAYHSHQLLNPSNQVSRVVIVATESYL